VFSGISSLDLLPGVVVEVSGVRDADNNIVASFIRRAVTPDQYQLLGQVDVIQNDDLTLITHGLVVDYGSADTSELQQLPGVLGQQLVVSGDATNYDAVNGRFVANRLFDEPALTLDDGVELELEGIVTAFSTVARFDVNGHAVATSATTRIEFQNGVAADATAIALNTRVEVEGSINAEGIVAAERVIVIPADDSKLFGVIESIESNGSRLTVLGVDITTTPSTRFDADSDLSQSAVSFESLRVGDTVGVRAAFQGSELVASRIRLEEADDEARLRGPVTHIDAGAQRIDVLNIPIVLGAETEFETESGEEVPPQQFLDQVQTGDIVGVRWKDFQSTAAPADQLELER
jgi:hypothetical protein